MTCYEMMIERVSLENIGNILDLVNSFWKRDAECLVTNQEVSTHKISILAKIKEYCLDFTQSHSAKNINDHNDDLKIFTLNNVSERDMELSHRYPLFDLLKESYKTDLTLKLKNGKIVKCHKTILSSRIPFFQTLFNGNWNNDDYVYDQEMEFIVQYCYGFIEQIPSQEILIYIMMKAHELDELVIILQSHLTIHIENFFEIIQFLKVHLKDPMFIGVKRKLVEFGVKNAKKLFTTYNMQHIDSLPVEMKNDLILAFANK